jgi:hypothetical protein
MECVEEDTGAPTPFVLDRTQRYSITGVLFQIGSGVGNPRAAGRFFESPDLGKSEDWRVNLAARRERLASPGTVVIECTASILQG